MTSGCSAEVDHEKGLARPGPVGASVRGAAADRVASIGTNRSFAGAFEVRREMKNALAVLSVVVSLAFASLAGAADSTAKTTLSIKGMTCGGCVAAVKVQLKRTVGVTAYDVSLDKAEADVTYDPGKTDPKKIAESVSKTGFIASVKEADGSGKGSSMVKNPEPRVKDGRLESWEPVDVAFTGCSEGVCGLRGRNAQA